MSLALGIVGLPNVGKSTLFNALVKNGQAEASNYPFCTIDPNVGLVEVSDFRLKALAEIVHPALTVPAMIEFVDIAGIIKGASEGEGLGNKFLAHIRECSAILLVARFFQDENIIHVSGELNPLSDLQTVLLELVLADLDTASKLESRYIKAVRGGDKSAQISLQYLQRVLMALNQGLLAKSVSPIEPEDWTVVNEAHFLTNKPMLIVANVSESDANLTNQAIYTQYNLHSVVDNSDWIIPISAKLEAELSTMDSTEQAEFLASYGLQESGLHRLTKVAYHLLGLQTFLTAGPKEVKAWTVRQGAKAPEAAGVIHSDFTKAFIRAEVISFDDYIQYGGELGAKEAGKMRLEGKDYIMKDGDTVHFRVGV